MDPYEVLGVSRDADEETIKKAYKELVKKYHPDKYVNSPMADVASEKMKEINRAYDMITKGETTSGAGYGNTGAGGGYNPYGQYNPYGGGYTNAQPSFQTVRMLIQIGALAQAQQMLNALPKTAEWYYLYALICQRRGWYAQAVENMQKAVNMEPNNAEYQAAMNNMKNRQTTYTQTTYRRSDPCDCCPACFCIPCLCGMPCC